jgi:hypothetical protein
MLQIFPGARVMFDVKHDAAEGLCMRNCRFQANSARVHAAKRTTNELCVCHNSSVQSMTFQWGVFSNSVGGIIKLVVQNRAAPLAEVDPSLFGAPLVAYGAESSLAAASAAAEAAATAEQGRPARGGEMIGLQLPAGVSLSDAVGGTVCSFTVSSRGGGTVVGISSTFGCPPQTHK